MKNMENVQKDLKNKLLGRIDEVHDDVKLLRKIVDSNMEDIANELMAKSEKEWEKYDVQKFLITGGQNKKLVPIAFCNKSIHLKVFFNPQKLQNCATETNININQLTQEKYI